MDWSDWMSGDVLISIDTIPLTWEKGFPSLYKQTKDFIGKVNCRVHISRYTLTVSQFTHTVLNDNGEIKSLEGIEKTIACNTPEVYLAFKDIYEAKRGAKCVNERDSEEMRNNIINKIEEAINRNKDATDGEMLKEEVMDFLGKRMVYVKQINPPLNPIVECTALKKVIDYFNNEYKREPSDSFESLIWDFKKEQLIHQLRKKLLKDNFINESTNTDYFYYTFKGKKLSYFGELDNRIKWTDNRQNIYELIFLLRDAELILKDGLIPKDDKGKPKPHKIHKVVFSCFSIYDNSHGNFKEVPQTRGGENKLEIQGKTDRQELLAQIVYSLLM